MKSLFQKFGTKFQRTLQCLSIAVATGAAAAQELPPHISEHVEHDEILDMHMFSPDLPTAKAFAAYALSIHELERHIPGAGDEELVSSLGVSKTEATTLTQTLVASFKRIKERSLAHSVKMSCIGKSPRVFDDEAFAVIQEMYDFENNAELNEYQDFVSTLSARTRQNFNAVLEKHKTRTAYFRINHKKSYARTGRSVDAEFAQYCLGLTGSNGAPMSFSIDTNR